VGEEVEEVEELEELGLVMALENSTVSVNPTVLVNLTVLVNPRDRESWKDPGIPRNLDQSHSVHRP